MIHTPVYAVTDEARGRGLVADRGWARLVSHAAGHPDTNPALAQEMRAEMARRPEWPGR